MKYNRIYIFTFIQLLSLLLLVRNVKSDSNCIINGLEADTCQLTEQSKIYNFQTTSMTVISGTFELEEGVLLNFAGPVTIDQNAKLSFNCNMFIESIRACVQIYSNQIVMYHTPSIQVRLDISNFTNGINMNTMFTDYPSNSTYYAENNLTPEDLYSPEPLFYAIITSPSGYNTSYYSTENNLYFNTKQLPITRALDLNVTTNCYYISSQVEGLISNSGIDQKYIYYYVKNQEIGSYFYVRVYPNYKIASDPNIITNLITPSFMSKYCSFNSQNGNTLKYMVNQVTPFGVQPTPPPSPTPSVIDEPDDIVSSSSYLEHTILLTLLVLTYIMLIN
ncbi:hypothetical protein DLAC_11224 [Tieghemostelium lacteum]|uniref:Transmembrane protein n=1 Tax=Tieghemostelium lacteum TaxID=361077 RepID=A0A151Z3G9_TIELA|nr:hypothetical protein DLAC_11224 [Tieghemostelium lacteum]|eukprot:KYQ88506.1 hypothetical protein DLAC_11224 [Tieghemostelium lacteum]